MLAISIPALAKKGRGNPEGISPMMSLPSRLQNSEMTVITIKATKVAGTFLVSSGKSSMMRMVPKPSSRAVTEMPSATAAGMPITRSIMVPVPLSPTKG